MKFYSFRYIGILWTLYRVFSNDDIMSSHAYYSHRWISEDNIKYLLLSVQRITPLTLLAFGKIELKSKDVISGPLKRTLHKNMRIT